MGKYIIISPLIFLIAISCAKAQNSTYQLTCEEYGNITVNDITIETLNDSYNNNGEFPNRLGDYSSIEESSGTRSRTYVFGSNSVGINYEFDHVTNISIKNADWYVTIEANKIRVGDTVASLKQAFGSDLTIGQSEYFSEHFVAFGCRGNDYDGWILNINPERNKIYEIVYFVNP